MNSASRISPGEDEKSLEIVWRDSERILCRVSRNGTGDDRYAFTPALYASEHPTAENIERLEHEFELKDYLESDWAVRPLELIHEHGRTLLVVDFRGEERLDRLIGHPLEIGQFLRLAIDLSVAIGKLHGRGLVHKDIKPAHILVDTATSRIRLTGFGIASRLPREHQPPSPPEFIAGTLPYMAPEQTGRMNRSIDSRSDLYSMGITLYQMLTGSLPFEASDPLEWVHCHIAKKPVSPAARLDNIPGPVSSIIMRLLSKTLEERYQTALGVESDLRKCLAAWTTCGRIDAFTPGEHDVPDRLMIPEKLYGREAEIEMLLAAFARVADGGATELVLVSGSAGIGKSSIVHELHKVLVPPRGFFASGKFDQYKRDIPYSTLAQAFQSLIRPLLSKSEAELSGWRDAILEAVGPNGQLIAELVPELKHIVGEQSPVLALSPNEAQGRFKMALRCFIGVFAQAEHPLVLFLDDLQWLDTATLDLLEDLLIRADLKHLLLIGAYRVSEVDSTHPLARKIDAMRQAGALMREIALAPLVREDLGHLLVDSLHCELERAVPLAELVHEKTTGNPFFAIQFISTLIDEALLTFDYERGQWSWDLNRVHAKGYTDNVVELMVGKLKRLSADTQKALQQFAYLGNSADFDMLRIVYQDSNDEMHEHLWEAVRTGIIYRSENSYRFLHDRVQEAAYTSIPEDLRAEAHLRIGNLLAEHTPPERLEEAIFEIVNQLNPGSHLITSAAGRVRLAELNLIAGKRAKISTAYASALRYLRAGRAILTEEAWELNYDLIFSIECLMAESELLTTDMGATENRLAMLAKRARNHHDFAVVTRLQITLYTTLDKSDLCVEVFLEFLRRSGTDWSHHPTRDEVMDGYERVWSLLGHRQIEELINLPLMTNSDVLDMLDVFTEIVHPAFFYDENLSSLVVCHMVSLSLEHGNCDASCFGYVWFAMFAGPRFNNYKDGYRFGQLGFDLVEKRGLMRYQARTYLTFATLTPWARHAASARDLIRRAFDAAHRAGDLTYSAYSWKILVTNYLITGYPLADVQSEAEKAVAFATKSRFGLMVIICGTQRGLIRTLRGLTPKFGCFDDEEFDELRTERHLAGNPAMSLAEFFYWTRKLQGRFFAGDHAAAIAASERAQGLLWTATSQVTSAELPFYGALARAASWDSAPPDEKQRHFEALTAHHRQLEVWAEHCPENFENREALVGAEVARIEGRDTDAMRLYEQAIRSARDQGFVQNEGVAHEVAARFYKSRGFETITDAYLRNARACFEKWGAQGKVNQLDALHPHLRTTSAFSTLATMIDTPVTQLDAETVVKASQSLSSEMNLPSLIEKLLRLALENAGAERGLLIFVHGEGPRIETEATTGRGTIDVAVRQVRVTSDALPQSILQYVLRTGECLVFDDVSAGTPHSDDQYIREKRPKSVLCMPILKHAKVIGALYLENTLTAHCFTERRVAVLEFLASQAAISFENARLYSKLSRSEALLSEGQKLSRTGSFGWNASSGEFLWSDETSRILGCDPATKQSLEFVFSRIHPDDFLMVKETLDHATREGTNLDFEHRLLLPDGAIKHVHVVARAADGREGKEFAGAVMDVTSAHHARMALEQAFSKLKKSEENFRLLADNIPGMTCVMTPTGETEIINQRVVDYTGKTLEELKVQSWASVVHPDDLEHVISVWGRSLEDGCPYDIEHRILGATGEYRWFRVRGLAMRDADGRVVRWYVSIDDIHDRRISEEKLVRSEGLLAEGQRISSTGTFSWRLDTDEVRFSEELHRIFEFDRNAVVTLEQIGQRVHPEDVALLSATIERARNGEGNFDYGIRLRMPDGRIKYLHTLSHTMRHQDGRLENLGAIQDITQRRLSDEALDKAQMELAHVSRMTTLGELSASIAHEVNQPLGSVVNNANACLSILPKGTRQLEEVREALAEIIEGADRASAVVARVRQLSKKMPYERTLVSLKNVVTDVLDLADNEAVRRQVTIRTDLPDGLPCVLGDRVQLQQVLLNLVVNGMDAMSNVEPTKRMMTISGRGETRDGKPEALISVQDAGIGLKPGEKDRLFEAFYSTKPEGMGMGLAISRSIIEAHGGRLWVETNQGAGATLLFRLPAAHQTES